MMQAFRTENNYRNASRLSAAELRAAMASREILQTCGESAKLYCPMYPKKYS